MNTLGFETGKYAGLIRNEIAEEIQRLGEKIKGKEIILFHKIISKRKGKMGEEE